MFESTTNVKRVKLDMIVSKLDNLSIDVKKMWLSLMLSCVTYLMNVSRLESSTRTTKLVKKLERLFPSKLDSKLVRLFPSKPRLYLYEITFETFVGIFQAF